jgi:hypothetical protein
VILVLIKRRAVRPADAARRSAAYGTPEGIGPLVAGDSGCVEIEGVGALTNRVVDGS